MDNNSILSTLPLPLLANIRKITFVYTSVYKHPRLFGGRARTANQTINFFYACKNQTEAIFDAELRALTQTLNGLTYNLCLSQTDGRLTADKLLADVDDLSSTAVFLCGPATMMKDLAKQLQARGMKKEQIIFEDFSYH